MKIALQGDFWCFKNEITAENALISIIRGHYCRRICAE